MSKPTDTTLYDWQRELIHRAMMTGSRLADAPMDKWLEALDDLEEKFWRQVEVKRG